MMVKLPRERGEQLRAFAAANHATTVEAISLLMNVAIEVGLMAAGIPGFEITPTASKVQFAISGTEVGPLNPGDARDVADAMDAAADDGTTTLLLIGDDAAEIRRARGGPGGSVKITWRRAGWSIQRVVTPSVARDVAGLLRKAAEQVA
jgi:hypothetical protein